MLKMWEIPPGKVSAILTDNGSNMIAAYRNIRVRIDEESEDYAKSDEESEKGDEESDFEMEDERMIFSSRSRMIAVQLQGEGLLLAYLTTGCQYIQ